MKNQKTEGPHRTWKCESGRHEETIMPNSLLAMAWEKQQEQGNPGPLIIPDVSCVQCHPRKHE